LTHDIEPARTALLLLDFQNDIVTRNLPGPERAPLLERTADALGAARDRGLLVVHVVVRFRPGYPEISPRDVWRRAMRGTGRLMEGSPGAAVVAGLTPLPEEIVVVKRRTGAFATTDLEAILRARDIDTIVLAGIATGGSVLSTVRAAADLDYTVVVLADCCADLDEDVHRVLCEKVFPRQATVATAADLRRALEGRPD
jgi:nicotinamidase-related amidase